MTQITDKDILKYFRDMPYDATNMRLLALDEPFVTLLEHGEITRRHLSYLLTRCWKKGWLEKRGVTRSTVYRLTPAGRQFLEAQEETD